MLTLYVQNVCLCPTIDQFYLCPAGEDEQEENQKVKTQRPRSADEPAVYMAQTGEL